MIKITPWESWLAAQRSCAFFSNCHGSRGHMNVSVTSGSPLKWIFYLKIASEWCSFDFNCRSFWTKLQKHFIVLYEMTVIILKVTYYVSFLQVTMDPWYLNEMLVMSFGWKKKWFEHSRPLNTSISQPSSEWPIWLLFSRNHNDLLWAPPATSCHPTHRQS